jgi:hypothetical protein
MVLHGVSNSIFGATKYLHIDDPIYGKSTLEYDEYATNYRGSGSWTHTYFTKKFFYFMWFKDLAFNPVLLKPIPEIRPLLAAYDEHIDLEKLSRESDFGIPHFVYNVPLNTLLKEPALPHSPVALRVLQLKKDAPVAYYDLGLDEQSPKLLQMNTSQAFFELMNSALGKLKSASKEHKASGELRLLTVPALNMEALWLAYTGRTPDLFTILPRFKYEDFDNNKVYEADEFLKLLRKAASKVKQDDAMGA